MFVQISSSMTVTFPSPHCWLSRDLYRPSKDAKVLRQLLVPDPLSFRLYWPCQHRAPFFFTRRRQRRSEFLWQASGMWSPQPVSGPRSQDTLIFLKVFQHKHMSGSYLRLMSAGMFVVWQVVMSFFCLITSRSGRYGGRMLPWRG